MSTLDEFKIEVKCDYYVTSNIRRSKTYSIYDCYSDECPMIDIERLNHRLYSCSVGIIKMNWTRYIIDGHHFRKDKI